MGASSNTHALSTSATTTPEAIYQIKKQRTCQIPEQKNGMVEIRKATECEAIEKTKDQSKQKSNETKKLSTD